MGERISEREMESSSERGVGGEKEHADERERKREPQCKRENRG